MTQKLTKRLLLKLLQKKLPVYKFLQDKRQKLSYDFMLDNLAVICIPSYSSGCWSYSAQKVKNFIYLPLLEH